MTRAPTEIEQRCVDAVMASDARMLPPPTPDQTERAAAQTNYNRQKQALRIVRLVIREMRVATPEQLLAMAKALKWSDKRAMGGRVTPTIKHQLRWAAAIDTASPKGDA